MNNENVKSQLEEEFEKGLRDALEKTPILMVADVARIMRNVTDRVCDEYIEKSEEYQKMWALNIVRQMMSGEQPSKLEKEEKDE